MHLALQSDEDILAVVNPIMDKLMAASTAIDYERHIQDFTMRAKSMLPKERFQSVCREYQASKGFFASRELVAIFRRPDSIAVIWKQWFSQQPGEYVAELVLVQQEGNYLIDHVMIF